MSRFFTKDHEWIDVDGTTGTVGITDYAQGQLGDINRGNGKNSVLGYDDIGRLNTYNHTGLNDTSFDHNPANQITSRVVTNANYQTALPEVGVISFTPNVLNQYESVNWQPLSYDLNGNTTAHDGWTYDYNAHNRLISASKTGTNLSLAYDAIGRLNSSTLNGSKTTFLYDGDELVAEYNASGFALRNVANQSFCHADAAKLKALGVTHILTTKDCGIATGTLILQNNSYAVYQL